MANPLITVPTFEWYRVLVMYGQFETNSIGGTRQVVAEVIDPNANVVAIIGAPQTQIENTIGYYTFSIGFVASGTTIAGNVFAQAPLPDLLLSEGYQLELAVQYVQTGDMWTSAYAFYEMYKEDYTQGAPVPIASTPVLA